MDDRKHADILYDKDGLPKIDPLEAPYINVILIFSVSVGKFYQSVLIDFNLYNYLKCNIDKFL